MAARGLIQIQRTGFKAALNLFQRTSTSVYAVEDAKIVDPTARSDFVFSKISEAIADKRNRLFAVVFINGRQYKVSDGDIIVVEHNLPVDLGDRIKLEKVLLVGGKDFTVLGRPIISPDAVEVHATVVEKTTSQPDVEYLKLAGKKVERLTWLSKELNILRINDIRINSLEHL